MVDPPQETHTSPPFPLFSHFFLVSFRFFDPVGVKRDDPGVTLPSINWWTPGRVGQLEAGPSRSFLLVNTVNQGGSLSALKSWGSPSLTHWSADPSLCSASPSVIHPSCCRALAALCPVVWAAETTMQKPGCVCSTRPWICGGWIHSFVSEPLQVLVYQGKRSLKVT